MGRRQNIGDTLSLIFCNISFGINTADTVWKTLPNIADDIFRPEISILDTDIFVDSNELCIKKEVVK